MGKGTALYLSSWTLQDQMGHSSIQVTVDIYGHLIPGADVSFVDKLDAATSPQESARQPQERKRRESDGFREVLPNEWLGGRDSNHDMQIQNLLSPADSKGNQQLSSANRGRVRQNPQRRRKKNRFPRLTPMNSPRYRDVVLSRIPPPDFEISRMPAMG